MNKHFIQLLLIVIILTGCGPVALPLSPTATFTPTITPSPTLTPEPTTIPETAEQKMNRITEVEISQGATMDPSTWTHSEEGKLFAQIVLDPEGVRDSLHLDRDQYKSLLHDQDAYITSKREKYFNKLLSSPETSQQALTTVQTFLHMKFHPDWASIEVPSTTENAIEVVKNLTPLQRLFLEIVRTNLAGEHMTPSIAEIIRTNSDPDNQVVFSENTNGGYVLPNAGGYFGGWAENSSNPHYDMYKKIILNPMFGLEKFEGKKINYYGNPDAGVDHAALAGLPVLPGEGSGILLIRRDASRTSRLQFAKGITTKESAITVLPPYPDQSGGWAAPDWSAGLDNIQPRAVTLTTQYAIENKDAYPGMQPLTEEVLVNSLMMPFRDVVVYWPNELYMDGAGNNRIQSLFLDHGIPVIGVTDEAKRKGVQAGIVFADHALNVWP